MANKNITSNGAQDDASFSTQQVLALIESTEEFPVDFDDAWQWIGYASKQKGRDKLVNHFEEGADYLTKRLKNPGAGRPSESIVLTTDCFKAWSMMAGTDKGKQIRQYFIQCEKELKAKQAQPRRGIGAYSQRVSEMFNSVTNMPADHWCVLEECSRLLIHVEGTLGLPVDKADLLDGSVGKCWSNYRKGKSWAKDRIEFTYKFPDGNTVYPWAYQNSELLEFRRWLKDDYQPNFLPGYLKRKYGALVKA